MLLPKRLPEVGAHHPSLRDHVVLVAETAIPVGCSRAASQIRFVTFQGHLCFGMPDSERFMRMNEMLEELREYVKNTYYTQSMSTP